ncbi:MAG: DUF2779 domain-containing protein [Alkalispirochaeta sp.]
MIFSPADILLWTRCRRQWKHACLPNNERIPAFPREMTGEANLREVARVVEIGGATKGAQARDVSQGILREEDGPPVVAITHLVCDEQRVSRWHQATLEAIQTEASIRNGVLIADDQAMFFDLMVWHPRLNGRQVTLFRPGTGLRGVYAVEAATASLVLSRLQIPLAELQVAYLDKSYRVGAPESHALFRESNLLRRAEKRSRTLAEDVEALRATAAGAPIPSDYQCAQRCGLCAPRHTAEEERYSVFTLHKGAHIARELVHEGITDLRDVDLSGRRISGKQRIQISSVLSDSTHVDAKRLEHFLNRLEYPLHFLDFEAYAPSTPKFVGVGPYEHVPVIASLHRQELPDGEVHHGTFAAIPGVDQRADLFQWLRAEVGTRGSIVVFSKGFESAMVRQMAAHVQLPDVGAALIERMIDLLEPFSDFAVYHPEQRGKVSLKRVLPAFTEAHYEDSPLRDGMHANLAYTRAADRAVAASPEGTDEVEMRAAVQAEAVNHVLDRSETHASAPDVDVDQIVTYCGVDTIAMVHLVARLRELLAAHRL